MKDPSVRVFTVSGVAENLFVWHETPTQDREVLAEENTGEKHEVFFVQSAKCTQLPRRIVPGETTAFDFIFPIILVDGVEALR